MCAEDCARILSRVKIPLIPRQLENQCVFQVISSAHVHGFVQEELGMGAYPVDAEYAEFVPC
jgi:hypothetical protein